MARISKELAANMNEELRADILLRLDRKLRNEIQDEEIFEEWLTYGVPDGTETLQDMLALDLNAEDFAEMWNLAEELLNRDAEEG